MADEPVVEPVVEEVPPVAVVPEPEAEIHPLAEGGARFNEVYARMKQAEERATRAEAERAAVLVQQQRQTQQSQAQPFTPEQAAAYLQQQVDRGQMTPMDATNALSQFNARRIANETAVQVQQITQLNTRLQAASVEVQQYIEKVPALRNNASPDFAKVSDAAYALSEDMNLPVSDLRVQRAALRQVYGSIEKMAQASTVRAATRDASLPHVETGAGGRPTGAPAKADDGLKGISQKYIDFWTKRGYTRERMIEEAKYVDREPRTVRVQR